MVSSPLHWLSLFPAAELEGEEDLGRSVQAPAAGRIWHQLSLWEQDGRDSAQSLSRCSDP